MSVLPEIGPRPKGFDKATDRSVYLTLSLYISKERVGRMLDGEVNGGLAALVQADDPDSLALRDAIDPLFNDIADRERLGRIDDVLLATPGPPQGEIIAIALPPRIEWQTEGKIFRTAPPGLETPRSVVLRRFWYMHLDGALSYNLSFQLAFCHRPADFYFLAMMQKAVAPKEFCRVGWTPNANVHAQVSPFDRDPTGCLPIDQTRVSDQFEADARFWKFIERRFNSDIAVLAPKLACAAGKKKHCPDLATAKMLIDQEPYVEVPGLKMPASRYMFFIQDKRLFRRLMPSIPASAERRHSLAEMCQEGCYVPYADKIAELISRGAKETPPLVDMDADYWNWVLTRPDYREQYRGVDAEVRVAHDFKDIPAFEGDLSRPDCFEYLFMAGFNQNIIDFMNQDASEVQDSLDPIYPTNDRQEEESFFVRFANTRGIISYVQSSRSLEIGQDYIGTCPYAFLIHVSAMHNEFLARGYEARTFALIKKIRSKTRLRRSSGAANAFYDFRMGPYSDYHHHRYSNIFRYDTERDVFKALNQVRGMTRRDAFLEMIVDNVERQTRDLEARTTQSEEKRLNYLLGGLGALGLFQLSMTWAERLREEESPLFSQGLNALLDPALGLTIADRIELLSLRASAVFLIVLVGYAIRLLIRRLIR